MHIDQPSHKLLQARDIDGNAKFVPMPPNQQTVNMLLHEKITSKEEMVDWLDMRIAEAQQRDRWRRCLDTTG